MKVMENEESAYEIRPKDLVPLKGIGNYIRRNERHDLDGDKGDGTFSREYLSRKMLLSLYNVSALVGIAYVLTQGLEKLLR